MEWDGGAPCFRQPAVHSSGPCHGRQLFRARCSGMACHVFRHCPDDDGRARIVRRVDGPGARPWVPACILAAAGGLALWVCAGYLDAFPRIHRQCEERRAFIRHELAQGKRNIVVPPYEPVSLAPYVSVMWRMCSGDPDEFINSSVARYLGIESIRVDVCGDRVPQSWRCFKGSGERD